MPLGSLITSVGADLTQLEKDLAQAYQKHEAYVKRVEALQVRVSTSGVSGGRGTGGSGSVDAEYRRIEAARQSAEAEQRRSAASQAQAERDNARLGAETMRAKMADIQQQIVLKRELERLNEDAARQERRAQSEGQRMAGAQQSAEREDFMRTRAARIAAEFEKSNSVIGRMDKAILALDGGSLQNMLGTVKQIGRAFGVVGAFGIAGAVAAITKGGIELNREYQRQLTTMASILAMTTRVVDSQGHQVGRQQALNVQLAEAGKLYTLIRKEAASTILTGRELFGAVSANLGLGSAAGLKPEQTVQLSKQITQLAKASGLQGERQFAQETRALLTGQGLQSGTVARILGIFSKKQVEEHIQKGDLFTYIMDRINKAKPFLDRFRTSMDGVMTTLTTKAQDLNRMAFEKFFEKLTKRIGDLNSVLTQDRLEQWAEKISDGLIKVFDAIDHFVSGGGFQKVMDFFNLLVNNGTSIIAVFAAMRGALALGGAAASLRGFQRTEMSRAAQAAQLADIAGNLSAIRGGVSAGTGAATGVAVAESEVVVASGAVSGLTKAAGAAAAGLSVFAAGLVGFSIGTVINKWLEEHTGAGPAERYLHAQEVELAKRRADPKTARAQAQSDRDAHIKELSNQLQDSYLTNAPNKVGLPSLLMAPGEYSDKGTDAARISARRKAYDAAVAEDRQERAKDLAERQKAVSNSFRLESLQSEANARKRREAANEERVKAGLELGKLRDDKVREINAQAQLDAIQAKKKIADQSLLRKVLVEIEKKRIDDVQDYRAQRLIDFQQDLAKQTGMVRQAAEVEYLSTVKSIKDKKFSQEQEDALLFAAREAQQHKLRDLDVEEFLRKKQLEADSTGNVVLQLNLEYAQKEEAIRKEVRAHYQGQAAIREFRKETAQNEIGHQRALRDVITQNEDKARDLARRGIQTERERAESIKRFTREVADAQKQAAREIRDLIREQADARRDLVRAQRAGQFSEQRIGRRQQTLRGGGFLPATEGVEGTNFALQDEAGSLLRQFGIDTQVQRALVARNGKTLGEAMTGRQLRQLRDTFSGGDVEGGLGQLKELGINAQPRFTQSLRELGAKAIGNQEAGAQLGDAEGREQLKQQREDAGRQVEDAQRRIEELDQRHAEVLDSYKETISRLHVDFNQAVLKNADDLKSLSEEARRLAETLKASGISIRQDFANALRKTAGGPATQVGAEAAAQAQGAPVYNLIFNAESIKLDATGQEALRALADTLTQQKLRTAPARR